MYPKLRVLFSLQRKPSNESRDFKFFDYFFFGRRRTQAGAATPRQPVMIIYDIHVKTVVVFGI